MGKVKCKECNSRHFYPDQQLADFSNYAGDAFVVETVFQPVAEQYGNPRVWESICFECLLKMVDAARNDVAGMTYDDHLG